MVRPWNSRLSSAGTVLVLTAFLMSGLATSPFSPPADAAAPTSAAPASAGPSSAGAFGRAASRSRPRTRAIITFDKNHANPSNSRLTWTVLHWDRRGVRHVVESRSWRAGSGMLGRSGRNECAKGRGWLPNGRYRLRYHRDYHGNLIKGRAFRLDDHRCRNGSTRRVQLFLHTEQGAHNVQCPNRPGDQPCRWEYPRINDYKSAGCIKMAPTTWPR